MAPSPGVWEARHHGRIRTRKQVKNNKFQHDLLNPLDRYQSLHVCGVWWQVTNKLVTWILWILWKRLPHSYDWQYATQCEWTNDAETRRGWTGNITIILASNSSRWYLSWWFGVSLRCASSNWWCESFYYHREWLCLIAVHTTRIWLRCIGFVTG